MTGVFLLLLLAADPKLDELMKSVASSGRVLQIAVSDSERVAPAPQIAPGAPPLLRFRFFEGKERHRFGDLDLVLDDAGH